MYSRSDYSEPQSALEALGLDANEIDEVEFKISNAPMRKQICICGHGMLRHEEFMPGRWSCISGKMHCPCQNPASILVADDPRYFARRTEGVGPGHALSRGLRALERNGKSAKLLINASCQKCGDSEAKLLPVAINRMGRPSSKPEQINVLLCHDCVLAAVS